jgi:phosphoglycolate phosphatase
MSADARATGWTGPAPVHAVCFDLDGTLLDTAADIALALRRAFADRGLKAPTDDAVRQMIGKGSPTLVVRAMAACGVAPDAAVSAALVEGFFHHYGHLHDAGESTASPYPGVLETLPVLTSAGLALAVVTNKQHRYACDLLDHLGLSRHFDLVVGGDTCERRKPDPLPLHHACTQLGVAPADALMVGDSANDLEAARAAGMPVVLVPYGYTEGEDPRLWPCDHMVENLAQLPALLGLQGLSTPA